MVQLTPKGGATDSQMTGKGGAADSGLSSEGGAERERHYQLMWETLKMERRCEGWRLADSIP